MKIDGGTTRFIILALTLVSVTACALQGTVDGSVYAAVIATVVGGVVHASGTKQGAEASSGVVQPPVE